MTRPIDLDRALDDWLVRGPERLPDDVLDRVAAGIEEMPQRRAAGWTWRTFGQPSFFAAAAAIVLLAAVGLGLLVRSNVGDTAPTPTASAKPLPAAAGALIEPGEYTVDDPFPIRLSFTVPSGWQAYAVDDRLAGICWAANCDLGLGFWIVENLPVDGCRPDLGEMDPPVGPSSTDLAAALVSQPGYDTVGPVPTTVSGFDGSYLELTGRGIPDGGCSLRTTWQAGSNTRVSSHREHDEIWVLDVDGVRLVVNAFALPSAPDDRRAELRAMVESIRIQGR
jgi:hypothetical protein